MKSSSCGRFCIFMPLAVLAFVALLSFAVFELWNGVLANVVAVKAITYWQAVGLLVLAKILFGGFPGGRRGCGRGRGKRDHLLFKHWESLTPEQRETMRREMRSRFGEWPRPWCGREDGEEPGSEKTRPEK